jgi:hypothetical protein
MKVVTCGTANATVAAADKMGSVVEFEWSFWRLCDMKAVIADVPEHILEWRRRTGADQWDEMWEGVLHLAPSPNRDHQRFEYQLLRWLDDNWAERNGCRVYHEINVADPDAAKWTDDYRFPDLVMLAPARFGIQRRSRCGSRDSLPGR